MVGLGWRGREGGREGGGRGIDEEGIQGSRSRVGGEVGWKREERRGQEKNDNEYTQKNTYIVYLTPSDSYRL